MSIIQEGLARAGMELHGDALPVKERTVKAFQRLIAAMRAAEAEVEKEMRVQGIELHTALRDNLKLQERCHHLEGELRRLRVGEVLAGVEAMTTIERAKVLECA
jgi:uncharacterized protein with PIN domain